MRIAVIAGPVVVGGVGGSGTRVVAQLLIELGFSLGNDLNGPMDDRWFNFLFYRPAWFRRGLPDTDTGLDLMRKRAFGERRLTADEVRFILGARRDASAMGYLSRHPTAWAARRVWRFWHSPSADRDGRVGWGWKEPISHLLAPQLLAHFEGARYVHVIRNGLDMAFSDNRRQARRFGHLVGMSHQKGQRVTPPELLRYWVRANRRVLGGVFVSHPERTCLLNFDDLCRSPGREVTRLVDFLGLSITANAHDRLAAIPRAPRSLNRYAGHDLAAFDIGDLEAVTSLGFRIEEGSPSVR